MKGVPFFKVNFDNSFNGSYGRNDDYREGNDYTILSKERDKNIYNRMGFYPEIGVNNQKPVAPIYRAFEIERKLRKSKVIKDRLSKKTIESVAHIAATQEKYRTTHERYTKYMMSDDEPVRYKNRLIDTLVSIEGHLVWASITDSNFTIRCIYENGTSISQHLLQSSHELLWLIDNYTITKISADSIAQITSRKAIHGCFFLNKDTLFNYNPFSRKITRLDNIQGFKSSKIDYFLNW